jgi:hypothetical protein
MYTVLSLLYIFLMLRRIEHGAEELTNTAVDLNTLDDGGDALPAY